MVHVNLRPRPWMALPAAAVIAALVTSNRRRHAAAQDQPADVVFMLAMHDAFRRDLVRLERAVDAHEHGHLSEAERTGWEGFRAVRELATLVRDHLEHEEAAVLPLLERHLSRREWRSWLLTERGRRSFAERADFLGWVLDDAEPADRDAVMAELPPPAHVVYRWVLRPRYEAQHRWEAA